SRARGARRARSPSASVARRSRVGPRPGPPSGGKRRRSRRSRSCRNPAPAPVLSPAADHAPEIAGNQAFAVGRSLEVDYGNRRWAIGSCQRKLLLVHAVGPAAAPEGGVGAGPEEGES